MLAFDIHNEIHFAAEILYQLVSYMEQINFNIFVFSNRVYFIPRENIEIPAGYENHRFGGLEMIGYFIMKSLAALEAAESPISPEWHPTDQLPSGKSIPVGEIFVARIAVSAVKHEDP